MRYENRIWGMAILLLALLAAPTAAVAEEPAASGPTQWGDYRIVDVPLPDGMTLMGEPVPLDSLYAREMLDRELTMVVWDRAQVIMWLKRSGRYFPYIEKRLAEENLPNDLKYLPVAESSLLPYIGSRAGAVGTWQFMEDTGRRHGLKTNQDFDERLNFERSTEAALIYLKKLKNDLGSWALALAGYNCGENRIAREIVEQGVTDYYQMNLPMETERFVFRIAAIKLVLEDPEKYGYYIPADRRYEPVPTDRVQVSLARPIHFREAAQAIGSDYKTIRELNPEIQGRFLPAGAYAIQVPAGTGPAMTDWLRRAAAAPPRAETAAADAYIVQPGDSLSRIAARTGVSVQTLQSLNDISGSHIEIGQRLRLR